MRNALFLAGTALFLAFFTNISSANVSPAAKGTDVQPAQQTFVGEITRYPTDRAPVPFVIYDEARKADFFISDNDSDKVAKYDEKNVEITGTLDQANDTIKVESIKAIN